MSTTLAFAEAVKINPKSLRRETTDADEYAGLVSRVRSLSPALRANAQQCEDQGRTTDEIVALLNESGVFRMVQPRHVGGYELAPTIFLDVGAAIARECPSTSWVVNNLASHHLQLAHWPKEAQDEIWGVSRDNLVGSSYVWPSGKARRVKGGYRLSGLWPFSSGIHPCQWIALGAMAEESDGEYRKRYMLLPRIDYEIVNTWKVSGLKGTGSDDVKVDDVFVPEHRTLSYELMARGEAPGLAVCTGPLFRFPMPAAGGYLLASTLYGSAAGALEAYTQSVRAGMAKGAPGLAENQMLHERIGRVSALVDTVELTIRRRLEDTMSMLEDHGEVEPDYMMKLRRDAAYCARLCVEAVDLLYAGAGGSALYTTNPLQRFWRDIHAGAANMTIRWETAGQAFGRTQVGLPSNVPGLPI